ncbi:hypothetical protein DPMN_045263 [Dreissena polymorpha]|uniref:Uncharacterized protein n=1 Tax=Dreissena polymorpha TaxID=45954 RepID=A0A9D4HZH5_DREPO|nr:hypothetical protein DPMN_045263 [Dreissena polymorpha]
MSNKNVASRVLSKNALPPDIIDTNHLIKFHDDLTINVASRVLTRKNAPPPLWPYIIGTNWLPRVLTRKNAPPPDTIGANLLTKFHDDWKINVASIVLTRKNVLTPDNSIGINLLIKFHTDWTINVAYREKCPAPCSHVFQANVIILKLIQDIIETNLLNKFHEDWAIHVASRVLTSHLTAATQSVTLVDSEYKDIRGPPQPNNTRPHHN